jgi:uncharacterized protein YbjT (DUF2867 family)
VAALADKAGRPAEEEEGAKAAPAPGGPRRVAVLGATGYIGGLLVPRLLEKGHVVRCVVRDPQKLARMPWAERVETKQADLLEIGSLPDALTDQEVVYYLVHSMGAGAAADFAQRDRRSASNTALVAKEKGVRRIVYLGGLGRPGNMSEHLESRQEVGRVLAEQGVPVTEFRAAVIVGRGSVSFRIIRYLTERLPLMLTPRWLDTPIQPIYEGDGLRYLVEALEVPDSVGRVLEIGGADVLTYGEMIREYARLKGLRRRLIPVPVLTPRLSSYWVGLVTPISNSIATPLIEGLRSEVVVRDRTALELFAFGPIGYEEAVRRVLAEAPEL